jgi:hypothetical protein
MILCPGVWHIQTVRMTLWVVCIGVVALAAVNLLYNAGKRRDRRRACVLLLLAAIPLAGTTYVAFRPAPGPNDVARREPILLEDLNVRCDVPANYAPYAGAEADRQAALVLRRVNPEVYFELRVDKYDPDLPVSPEFFYRAYAEHIRGQAASVALSPPRASTVNGLPGLLCDTDAESPKFGKMAYVHWWAARNGFLYQCSVVGRAANRQAVRGDAKILLSSLRQIDPNRFAAPPFVTAAPGGDEAPRDQ